MFMVEEAYVCVSCFEIRPIIHQQSPPNWGRVWAGENPSGIKLYLREVD